MTKEIALRLKVRLAQLAVHVGKMTLREAATALTNINNDLTELCTTNPMGSRINDLCDRAQNN